MPEDRFITIGRLSERTGVAVSAIRFYEEKGLLASLRTSGNQRLWILSEIAQGQCKVTLIVPVSHLEASGPLGVL